MSNRVKPEKLNIKKLLTLVLWMCIFIRRENSWAVWRNADSGAGWSVCSEPPLSSFLWCVTLPCWFLPHSHHSQSDTGSEKENPSSRRPSSCQPLSRFTCKDSGYEPTTSTSTTAANSHQAEYNRRHQSVDGHLHSDLSLASHRGEGEGWDREQAKRLEERNRWFEEGVPFSEMGCRWESMELKKGSVPVPVIETMDSEVNRKWVEFETLSFRDMSPQSLIGDQASQSNPPQAPQSPVTTQTHESSPEEAEHSVTGSQADLKSSKEAPSSLNGVQTIHTNTTEALQKEVRRSYSSLQRK